MKSSSITVFFACGIVGVSLPDYYSLLSGLLETWQKPRYPQ